MYPFNTLRVYYRDTEDVHVEAFGVSYIILCRYVTDILKMCMWKIKGTKIYFDKFTAF